MKMSEVTKEQLNEYLLSLPNEELKRYIEELLEQSLSHRIAEMSK